jgi:hypothetical protein
MLVVPRLRPLDHVSAADAYVAVPWSHNGTCELPALASRSTRSEKVANRAPMADPVGQFRNRAVGFRWGAAFRPAQGRRSSSRAG